MIRFSNSQDDIRWTYKLFLGKLLLSILLTVLFSAPYSSIAQDEIEEEVEEEIIEKQFISISELASLMQENEEVIILSNLVIEAEDRDAGLMVDKVLDTVYEVFPLSTLSKKIHFFDCEFRTGNRELVFKDWLVIKLDFLGCTFDNPITFENINLLGNFPINIDNCIVRNTLFFSGSNTIKQLIFSNNTLYKNLVVKTRISNLVLEYCDFTADTILYKEEDEEKTHFQFDISNNQFGQVKIRGCNFTSNGAKNLFSADFRGSIIENLVMFKNTMRSIDFSLSTVEKSLLVDSLFVEKYIGILNFDFPERNTNIPWYNFSGEKLALLYREENEEILTAYQAKTTLQLASALNYNDLISSYTKLNSLYHQRGDIHSANKSYVEIKTLETRRQKFLLDTNWDLNVYINYKLNVFLSFFSDYATNPGKSLILSLWMLLFFAVLYMLTFSDWDGMNYSFFLNQFNLFVDYIIENKDVRDVYSPNKNPHQEVLLNLQENYINSGKKIPIGIRLFGKPLHFIASFRLDMMPNLISLFNFQPKSWENLKTGEKIYSGILITFIVISFFIYVLVVKFINGVVLSLNSFILIGFGSMPEIGFAMYLTVIEGIIGWFLLTIFTITLLSQVLQNA